MGAIVELDWDGNQVWTYRNPMLHHDFVRLPNGNSLVLLFEEIPSELAAQVRGGYEPEHGPEDMLGDVVQEITPGGEAVYRWLSWERYPARVLMKKNRSIGEGGYRTLRLDTRDRLREMELTPGIWHVQ